MGKRGRWVYIEKEDRETKKQRGKRLEEKYGLIQRLEDVGKRVVYKHTEGGGKRRKEI